MEKITLASRPAVLTFVNHNVTGARSRRSRRSGRPEKPPSQGRVIVPERSGGAGATPQRIVFMASRQAVYQCLSQAAQRHFTMFEVSLLDHLSSAEMPDSSVRLVLVSHGDGWTSASNVRECRRRFPAAAIGLVVERGTQELDVTLMDHQLVQGILPLTLPLDVWLAVASLLVAGGEYLSQDGAFHRDVQREWAVPPAARAPRRAQLPRAAPPIPVAHRDGRPRLGTDTHRPPPAARRPRATHRAAASAAGCPAPVDGP